MSAEFQLEEASLEIGKKRILHPLSLSLKAGELTVLIGPNGAGKSTFLKLITGDHTPSSGRILFESQDLAAWPVGSLALRRAVMPQSSHIAFPFTVLEVVRLGAMVGSVSLDEASELAMMALEKVEMAHFAGSRFQELSGGEQQRVQLARTLSQVWSPVDADGAKFLFLDEPISNLDIRHQIEILELAKNYTLKGGGCIAVLHDLNISAMYADRLLVIHQGKIAADGHPNDILTNGLMADIFGVALQVSSPPRCAIPYVLPQSYFDLKNSGQEMIEDDKKT